jgi:hypothetical protein
LLEIRSTRREVRELIYLFDVLDVECLSVEWTNHRTRLTHRNPFSHNRSHRIHHSGSASGAASFDGRLIYEILHYWRRIVCIQWNITLAAGGTRSINFDRRKPQPLCEKAMLTKRDEAMLIDIAGLAVFHFIQTGSAQKRTFVLRHGGTDEARKSVELCSVHPAKRPETKGFTRDGHRARV